MDTVVAAVSAASSGTAGDTPAATQLSSDVSAVNVIFQVRNRGFLARDHVFDEVTDRDHADNLVRIDDRQVANVFIGHQSQTSFNRFARMRDGHIA